MDASGFWWRETGACGAVRKVFCYRSLSKLLSFITSAAREINCKSSTTAPGLGGKTTTCSSSSEDPEQQRANDLVATETDRPCSSTSYARLGTVLVSRRAFIFYTVPGQFFTTPAAAILRRRRHVFVADSQQERQDAKSKPRQPDDQPERTRLRFQQDPYVLKLNKRDLPNHCRGYATKNCAGKTRRDELCFQAWACSRR